MFEDLNQTQIDILFFIKQEIQRQGFPPTVREICSGVGLKSTSTAHNHLTKLEEKDYIRRNPTKPRAIEIIDGEINPLMKNKKTIDVPVLGKIAAGMPLLAMENIEDTWPIPYDVIKEDDVFLLRVSGQSMIDAHILDGDLVVIKRQNTAKNGDIVVALIDEEATLKTFYKENDYIKLQPENKSMEAIITKEVTILGILIGLHRYY